MSEVAKPVKQKLSHSTARAIVRDIIDNEWQEGHFIGREPELLKRYDISRDTFREALRVLEWQGLAHTTRGPKGGLVVAKPSQDAIVNILRDYFDLAEISFREVMEVRHRLQRLTTRLATIRLNDGVVPKLNALLEESTATTDNLTELVIRQLRLIHEIGNISGNSVLSLFIEPLDYVAIDYADIEKLSMKSLNKSNAEGNKILRNLVSAIIANDESSAVQEVDNYFDLSERVFREEGSLCNGDQSIYPQWFDSGHNKSAHALIYRIKDDIKSQGLDIGDRLGSEVELIKQYSVSRSIFREASRILELIGVTQSQRGRDGGLIISKADPSNTIEAATQFLEYSKLPFDQVYESRVALESFAAELAAKNCTEIQLAKLDEALEVEAGSDSIADFITAAMAVQRAICHAGGNQVLALYIDILMSSMLFRPTHKKQLKKFDQNRTLITRSHQRIIKAIKERDPKLASRYIRDHRAQVASYFEM